MELEKKEEKLLRQLAEARKQAFEERMRLKEKMAAVGGRPSSNIQTQTRIHNTPPEERRKNRDQRRKSLESKRLQELRQARVQAYEERIALKKRMEGMDGRPVSSVQQQQHHQEVTKMMTRNTSNNIDVSKKRDTYTLD